MSRVPVQLDPERFNAARPTDLRRSTPWHRYSYIIRALPAALERLAPDLALARDARVLDYGCAELPYRYLFPAEAEVVGADLPGNPFARLEIRPDGTLPAADESFDAVLSTQVLEHVADPDTYLAECFRVLRPGGRLLLSTHGMMVYHPDPVDYWRWTCAGLRQAVAAPGFQIERFEGIMGMAATGLQLLQESVYYRAQRFRLVQHAIALVFQTLAALADRLQGQESKDLNALVFALVARRPERAGG